MVVGLWQWILVGFVVDCESMVVWLDFFLGFVVAGLLDFAAIPPLFGWIMVVV